MRYHLQIGEHAAPVDAVQGADPTDLTFTLHDRVYQVGCRIMNEHLMRLKINGKWRQAFLCPHPRGTHICIQGKTFLVQDARDLSLQRCTSGAGEDASGEITPPMPSIVVRILVQKGDGVKKGQGLVVLRAMKMETTLSAPRDGTIARIHTAVDARVTPGDILVEMEAEEKKNE